MEPPVPAVQPVAVPRGLGVTVVGEDQLHALHRAGGDQVPGAGEDLGLVVPDTLDQAVVEVAERDLEAIPGDVQVFDEVVGVGERAVATAGDDDVLVRLDRLGVFARRHDVGDDRAMVALVLLVVRAGPRSDDQLPAGDVHRPGVLVLDLEEDVVRVVDEAVPDLLDTASPADLGDLDAAAFSVREVVVVDGPAAVAGALATLVVDTLVTAAAGRQHGADERDRDCHPGDHCRALRMPSDTSAPARIAQSVS